jgi:DNA invertase Pin-like site-specific DNA recombinase
MSAKKLAVSYARWSDPKQDTGDSRNRQEQDYRSFVQSHNLTPSGQAFTDEGTSGFRGKHRQKGQLKQLVEAAKAGTWDKGTVIVVEAWDRLGRQIPNKQIRLIEELLETGVNIGVCQIGDIFSYDDFGGPKWYMLSAFVSLAYQESKEKSRRVARAWKNRRDNVRAGNGSLPCQPPAWCEITNYEKGKGGHVRLIPERAAAIKRIFQLAGQGYGTVRIIQRLTAEGHEPFTGTGRWTRPYVNLILTDRRVLGEVQMKDREGNPDGEPIKGYLPALIGEDEFAVVQAALLTRKVGGKGGRDNKHINLFRGMVVDARDGETFHLHITRHGVLILRNRASVDGRGRHYSFPYLVFEKAVLSSLLGVDPADVLSRDDTPSKAAGLRARLQLIRNDLSALQADIKSHGASKTIMASIRQLETEEEKVATELQEETAKAARTPEKEWAGFHNHCGLWNDPLAAAVITNEDRLTARNYLSSIVSEIRLLTVRRGVYTVAAVQLTFPDVDVRRNLRIIYKAAGYRRKGGWDVWSSDDVDGSEWTLRPDNVTVFEQELMRLKLPTFRPV